MDQGSEVTESPDAALDEQAEEALVPPLTREQAIQACTDLCESSSAVLDSQCLGPLDEYWVCDIAHSPRQPQDDLSENQCPSYRSGERDRFVELTPDCGLIHPDNPLPQQ